jgi:ubiquinol-cytochrome c reductase cytochrome b subunit
MVGSIIILFSLPLTTENNLDVSEPRYRPGYTAAFIVFVFDMLMLGWLGGKAVTETILFLSQICTAVYLLYFLCFLPFYSQVSKSAVLYLLDRS